MQAFSQNPTLSHLTFSSTKSNPCVWKPQTLRLLNVLLEGTFLLILHCNPILHVPKHACKHFYRIQQCPILYYHQPSLIPEFGSHTRSALEPFTRGNVSINTPLQPNFTCPQTCMQAFSQNPTLSHLTLSSTESNP